MPLCELIIDGVTQEERCKTKGRSVLRRMEPLISLANGHSETRGMCLCGGRKIHVIWDILMS